jgi:hypothetical protein
MILKALKKYDMVQRLESKPVFTKSNATEDRPKMHYKPIVDRRKTIIRVAHDRRSGIADRRKPVSLATLLEEYKLK